MAEPLTPATGHCVHLGPFPQGSLGPQAALLALPRERRATAVWLLDGLRRYWPPGQGLTLPRLLRDVRPEQHQALLQATCDLLQAGALLLSVAPRGCGEEEGS